VTWVGNVRSQGGVGRSFVFFVKKHWRWGLCLQWFSALLDRFWALFFNCFFGSIFGLVLAFFKIAFARFLTPIKTAP
jgi:hypothetical protein